MKNYYESIILVIFCFVMSGCNGIKNISNSSIEKESMKPIKLLKLPKLPEGVNVAYPIAKTDGILVVENGCLFIVYKGNKKLLFFPWDSTIEEYKGNTQVRMKYKNHKDKILIVSKHVEISGGFFKPKKDLIKDCGSFNIPSWAVNPF